MPLTPKPLLNIYPSFITTESLDDTPRYTGQGASPPQGTELHIMASLGTVHGR